MLKLKLTSRSTPKNCGPSGCEEYPYDPHQGGHESEMRRRRGFRSEYDNHYPPDARMVHEPETRRSPRSEYDDHEPDMRRRRSSRSEYEDYEPETRRRSARSEYDDHEPDMRRRRARSEYEDYEPETRRRSTRSEYDDHYPESRRMGFATSEVQHMRPLHEPMGFAKALPGKAGEMIEEAHKVLESPPPTWSPYIQKKDFPGLVKMETREMIAAIENGKSPEDIKTEVKHVLAALLKMVGD